MSEDEDAPGTWENRNGFGRPYIPFPCTGLLIPRVQGAQHAIGRYPRITTSYLIQ